MTFPHAVCCEDLPYTTYIFDQYPSHHNVCLFNKVPFPTVTICGSGFHMDNVEKKVVEDFSNWRKEKGREDLGKIVEDMADYMEERFLIKADKGWH